MRNNIVAKRLFKSYPPAANAPIKAGRAKAGLFSKIFSAS
jgi:hypothetical protein